MTNRHGEFDDPEYGILDEIKQTFARAVRMHGRGSLLTFMVVLFMIAVLVAVLWYSSPGKDSESADNLNVPVIRADTREYRQEPENRGGMDVPNRDSTIFETLRETDRSESGGERVENLLDDSEKPIPRSKLLGLNQEQGNNAEPQNLLDESGRPITGQDSNTGEMPPAPKTIANVSQETRELVQKVLLEQQNQENLDKTTDSTDITEPPVQPLVQVAPPSLVEKPAPVQETVKKVEKVEPVVQPSASGSFFVQLASVKSKDAADGSWPQLQKKYSVLSSASYRVQEATVADRGTFFRVQAGPYSREDANSICDSIKNMSPGGCIVVSR